MPPKIASCTSRRRPMRFLTWRERAIKSILQVAAAGHVHEYGNI
jgi:hypothetical protein